MAEILNIIRDGGIWANIYKKLDYLVLGEKAGPAKVQKAKSYGIKTISADKFLQMVKKEE